MNTKIGYQVVGFPLFKRCIACKFIRLCRRYVASISGIDDMWLCQSCAWKQPNAERR